MSRATTGDRAKQSDTEAREGAEGFVAAEGKPEQSGLVIHRRTAEEDDEILQKDGTKGFPDAYATLKGIKTEDIDPALMEYLKQFAIVENPSPNGGLTVRFDDTKDYGMEVTGGGVRVVGFKDEELLSDAHLDSVVEAALLAKASSPNGVKTYHSNDKVLLAMNKAADLVGMEVRNKATKDLDVSDPELAKRVEQAWERVQAKRSMKDYAAKIEAEASADKGVDSSLSAKANEAAGVTLFEHFEGLTLMNGIKSDGTPITTDDYDYFELLKNTGLTDAQVDPENMAGTLAAAVEHGKSFIGDASEKHPVTDTPLIAEPGEEFVQYAAAMLKAAGVEDADGQMAKNLAALNQTVAVMTYDKPDPDAVFIKENQAALGMKPGDDSGLDDTADKVDPPKPAEQVHTGMDI